jgi:hypothetical protein
MESFYWMPERLSCRPLTDVRGAQTRPRPLPPVVGLTLQDSRRRSPVLVDRDRLDPPAHCL